MNKINKMAKGVGVTLAVIALSAFCATFQRADSLHERSLIVESLDSDLVRIQRTVHYKGSPFTGTLRTTDTDGSVVESSFYDGQRNGIETSTYSDGSLRYERAWKNGKREGKFESWWPDRGRKTISYYAKDVLEGELKEWFSDGTPARVFHYASGKEEGSQKMWFEDASLRANYLVVDGRRYGSIGPKGCEGGDDA